VSPAILPRRQCTSAVEVFSAAAAGAVGGRSNIKDAGDIYLPTTVRYWRPASLLTSRNARYSMINDVDAFRKWLVVVEYQLGPRP